MGKRSATAAPRNIWDEQDGRVARGMSAEPSQARHSNGDLYIPPYAPVSARDASMRFTPTASLGDVWDSNGRTL